MKHLLLLACVAACALLAGCASTTPVPVAENTMYIPPLRMRATKPPGWTFFTTREARAHFKNYGSTNKILNTVYYQNISVPFLTLARERRSEAEFKTLVTIDRISLGNEHLISGEKLVRFISGEKLARFVIDGHIRWIDGVRVIVAPRLELVAGEPFTYLCLRYPLGFKDGRRFEVEKHFWLKPSALSAMGISAEFDVRQAAEIWPEIQQILESLVLEAKPEPAAPPKG
ncbi:MAG: hypothetical protein V4773_22735 [Verrucomicrobiota bacterium]